MGLNDQDREFFLHYFNFYFYLRAKLFHQDNRYFCFLIFHQEVQLQVSLSWFHEKRPR
jgi:hypothetical protein